MIGRGHVWWSRLDKLRPAVIVSSEDVCDLGFWQIHVAPVSTSEWHAEFPWSVSIGLSFSDRQSFVSTIDVQLLRRDALVEHIGVVSRTEMAAIDDTVASVFGLR